MLHSSFDLMLHSSLLPQNLWTTNEKMGDPEKVREILVEMIDYFELYIYVYSVTLDVLFLRSIYHAITQGSGINIQNAATPILNFRVWGMVGQEGYRGGICQCRHCRRQCKFLPAV